MTLLRACACGWLLCVVAVGCGGEVTGASDGGADAGKDGALPSKDGGGSEGGPTEAGPPTSDTYTFAIDKVYLGEAPRGGGPPSSTAWKDFGVNLDSKTTDSSSTDVCTLTAGASKNNQVDGNQGIDNAWGAMLLPIMQSAASQNTPSAIETDFIDQGGWTLLLQVKGLSDDPAQTANGLTAQVFVGARYNNGVPAFDTSTDWPVLATSLADGNTLEGGSKIAFASASMSGGTFRSGPGSSPVVVDVSVGTSPLEFQIHDAVITFDHADHADAVNGTIAGVLDTEEFLTELKQVAGQITTALCGSAFDGVAQQIRQAQDILLDGTNTQGVPCTAISVGLGFEAKLVANPTEVSPAPPPPPDPCQ